MVSWKGTSRFGRVGLISEVKCVGGVRGRRGGECRRKLFKNKMSRLVAKSCTNVEGPTNCNAATSTTR